MRKDVYASETVRSQRCHKMYYWFPCIEDEPGAAAKGSSPECLDAIRANPTSYLRLSGPRTYMVEQKEVTCFSKQNKGETLLNQTETDSMLQERHGGIHT
jgi:hypothetical protein